MHDLIIVNGGRVEKEVISMLKHQCFISVFFPFQQADQLTEEQIAGECTP